MARPPREIDDGTPLDGSRIDLPARIGWLLRTWRTESGRGLQTLAEQVTAHGSPTSATALSRAEMAGERNSRLIDGYEAALGLGYGVLRAPLEVLCRTYDYRPADVARLPIADDLAAFSAVCDAVTGPRPVGADWLRFAEFHADGRFGLPIAPARVAIVRLARELCRAVGTGYQLRYEALARLRCSRYGDLVRDVVDDLILEPGAQRLGDLMSAVCERPTPELLTWCADLLDHPSDLVAHAACLGLQNLRSVGGNTAQEWAGIAPQCVAAIHTATHTATHTADHTPSGTRGLLPATGSSTARAVLLARTIATCPPALRGAILPQDRALLPDPPRPQRWTRNRLNIHYTAATELAASVAAGRHGEALLGRLLFELLFDFRASHAVTSGFLLAASVFADEVVAAVARTALDAPDRLTREGAVGALNSLMLPTDALALDVDALARPADRTGADAPDRGRAALRIAGFAGRAPARAVLLDCLDDPARRSDALFAAGMAGDPTLERIADDTTRPATLRQRAAWWLTAGPRVLDPT